MTEVFQNVGHVAYQNAQVFYTGRNGQRYQIGGSYSGAYPGATRDTQTLETDSVTINVSSSASAQQWSFQAPAAKHPAFDDLFAAQTDGSPRNFEVAIPKRNLLTVGSPSTGELSAAIGATETETGLSVVTFAGRRNPDAAATVPDKIQPSQYPVNAHIRTGSTYYPIVGIKKAPNAADKPYVPGNSSGVAAAAVNEIFMAGLQFGPFLANVDEVGQVDDTGVVVYRVAFTPVSVVAAPTQIN